jgi:DNA replication and repair protein RecF
MRITEISLINFRNHTKKRVNWAPGLNIITGPNGAGKTNLIDAIHYLCMTRSFIASSDQYVVAEGEKFFMLEGEFKGEIRSSFKVGCSYSRGEGKKIFINDSPLDRLSDLIGMVPVVVLSPEDQKLTYEGPAERRKFIDGFISQISPAYLRNLISYNRVRKQRNRLLQEYSGPVNLLIDYLDPWNQQLIESGSKIITKRTEVLSRFKTYLEIQFQAFSGIELKPGLKYETFCEPDISEEVIKERYASELEQNFEKEIEREQTITGPHRDEIVFFLGDMELRNYGSQGQHRLFSVALKLAQLFYYSDELDDLPIMLLDDVFGNLDNKKTEIILNTLQKHTGQTFITSASEVPFGNLEHSESSGNAWYTVNEGQVEVKT